MTKKSPSAAGGDGIPVIQLFASRSALYQQIAVSPGLCPSGAGSAGQVCQDSPGHLGRQPGPHLAAGRAPARALSAALRGCPAGIPLRRPGAAGHRHPHPGPGPPRRAPRAAAGTGVGARTLPGGAAAPGTCGRNFSPAAVQMRCRKAPVSRGNKVPGEH